MSEVIYEDFNSNLLNNSQIVDFYQNKNVLITGVTGFVGKTLLEKLLRCCDQINAIYVLIRSKRNCNAEQRLKQLFKNTVFTRLHEKNMKIFSKVHPIDGDVSLAGLGLNSNMRNHLSDCIDVVFHSAASVRFDENLRNAFMLNTYGTAQILELCAGMKRLKSFIHVSTAYSNSDKKFIDEIIYEPTYDPNKLLNEIGQMSDESLDQLKSEIMGKHPNTYTLTKSMAEYLVQQSSTQLPSAIVRPSIITAAWKEPYPGWVDNMSGITGILMECGRGTIRSIICDENCKMDLVPVDVVVNTIIVAGWLTGTSDHNQSNCRIYNCVSGEINPITWKQFREWSYKSILRYPSKWIAFYPHYTYRSGRWRHLLSVILFHLIPAAFLDLFLWITGRKMMQFKISLKFHHALKAGSFFSTNEWKFGVESMKKLRMSIDDRRFDCDMAPSNGFKWIDYIDDFVKGIRRYVLKDDDQTLKMARKRMTRLYWFGTMTYAFMMYLMYVIGGKLLNRLIKY